MSMLKKFIREEEGLELVEYAVMTALVVAAIITAITALSGSISGRFGSPVFRVRSVGSSDYRNLIPVEQQGAPPELLVCERPSGGEQLRRRYPRNVGTSLLSIGTTWRFCLHIFH